MKKTTIILTAAVAIIAFSACEKVNSDSENYINFTARITETKALLESADLLTDGTQVKIFGIASSNETIVGTSTDGTTGSTSLNNGQIIQYGSSKWPFINNNGEVYQWRPNSNHKFFGWLEKDNKSSLTASGFFGAGFSFNNNVLTIPAKTMGISETNFDFAYSEVVNRTLASANYSVVEMPLHHLFASFALSARNYTQQPIRIVSITMYGIVDGKSATIDYSGEIEDVDYITTSSTITTNPVLFNNSSSPITLTAAGESGDIAKNVVGGKSDAAKYFLVWPQTEEEITPEAPEEGEEFEEGTPGTLTVKYYEGTSTTLVTRTVALPCEEDLGWAPGVRHNMELSFSDKEVDLVFLAANWDKQEATIDYDRSPVVTGKLHIKSGFENNFTVTTTGSTTLYFKPGIPIILEFTIDQPRNATWVIQKKKDWDVFDVYNYPDGKRTSEEEIVVAEKVIDGEPATIAIDPPTKELQKNEFTLELSFSIRGNNGEMTNIDNMIFENDESPLSPRTYIYMK